VFTFAGPGLAQSRYWPADGSELLDYANTPLTALTWSPQKLFLARRRLDLSQ
jgi:hypothetical protein